MRMRVELRVDQTLVREEAVSVRFFCLRPQKERFAINFVLRL